MAIKKITAKNFRAYGWVIEYPDKNSACRNKNLFRIVLKEPAKTGWRIAYLVVRDRSVMMMEQHPDSFESFEPACGRSMLYLSGCKDQNKIKCFLLDKPVILKKGIWHAIVAVGRQAEIKITENSRVRCVYRPIDSFKK